MKYLFLLIFSLFTWSGWAQNLQIHYDFRHATDPALNTKNFPTFSFEYFKDIDTLETGSFLLKMDVQLDGKHNNIGKVFTQLSQSLKFWKPKVYLSLNYSGGLGVTPASYGYYLSNSFGIGVAYPFQWHGAWVATSWLFRANIFDKPSYDPQFNLYFGKGFLNYKILAAGSFVFWSENRNQGNEYTKDLRGKKFAFFGDPQIWFKVINRVSIGSRINVYYHLLSDDNQIQIYPTMGAKYQF